MSANDLYKELKTIDSQIINLKSQRTAVLAKFKVELVSILKYRQQLFEDLVDADDEMFNDVSHDQLTNVHSDGTTLTASFGFSFRNEWNTYELEIPAVYMMPNGREAVERDAIALADKQEAERVAKAQATSTHEHADFLRLLGQFGNAPVQVLPLPEDSGTPESPSP